PCSSRTCSPVYEWGAGKKIARPASMVSCWASRKRAKVALRGTGRSPRITAAISGTFGPDTRTIPTPPRPGGVAAATIVSTLPMARHFRCLLVLFAGGFCCDAAIDVPLLRDRQNGVRNPVQHQPCGEKREHERHHQGHEHEHLGLHGI